MGYKGRFIEVDDTAYPPIIGRTPWSLPRPIVIDTGAARELGYLPALSYQEALFETLDWLIATAWHGDWRARFPVLAAYPRELFDYAEEDSFLEQAGAHC
jgi:hypothetical protein